MTEEVRVLLYGLGSIGTSLARECHRRGLDLVAAVDVDGAKVGKDLGEVAGLGEELGVIVRRDLSSAIKKGDADVALHCTTSFIWEAHPQLAEIALAGCDVVSTCEELSYPWRAHRHFAQEIDQAAKREGVTILGTGVNPGFVMDALIISLSSMCRKVSRVVARRVVDVARRRLPLQRKVGVGMAEAQFREGAKEGQLGHVGTSESIDMLAAALGWNLTDVQVEIEPVLAEREYRSPHLSVKKGEVAGLRQVGIGSRKGEEAIRLELEMYMGAPAGDSITLEGDPPLEVRIPGGVEGDGATVAAVVNSIPRVVEAQPGLKTMLDMPLPSFASFWTTR